MEELKNGLCELKEMVCSLKAETNEETIIKITTNKGNAVMITEKQFDAFIDCMCRKGAY